MSISATTTPYQHVKLSPIVSILTIVGPECLPFFPFNRRWVTNVSFLRSPWSYYAQLDASSHNSPMLTTLAKFLHSGPALGFIELEHTQYTLSMWEMSPEFDTEKWTQQRKLHANPSQLARTSHEVSVGVYILLSKESLTWFEHNQHDYIRWHTYKCIHAAICST